MPSELIVPSETTWLNCTYDLENDHLYAIQWYKIIDGKAEEFYRYSFRTNNYLHNFSLTNLYTNFFIQTFFSQFFHLQYRYMPEQYPSVTIYEMPGVHVDVSFFPLCFNHFFYYLNYINFVLLASFLIRLVEHSV